MILGTILSGVKRTRPTPLPHPHTMPEMRGCVDEETAAPPRSDLYNVSVKLESAAEMMPRVLMY